MKSFQVLTLQLLQIISFSCSLPVIHHPLTRVHDSRIYFQNVGKWPSEPELKATSRIGRTWHHGNLISSQSSSAHDYHNGKADERIHFPDLHAEDISSRHFISDSTTDDPEAILFEPDYSQTRFRHALEEEIDTIQTSTTVRPFMETSTNVPAMKETEHEVIQKPVPLSFLEQWAKQHSTTSSESRDESSIVFDDGDKENIDKSVSFQSFLQIPRLTNSGRSSPSDCPPNQFRSHHGKCVNPIRIIVLETEDTDES